MKRIMNASDKQLARLGPRPVLGLGPKPSDLSAGSRNAFIARGNAVTDWLMSKDAIISQRTRLLASAGFLPFWWPGP